MAHRLPISIKGKALYKVTFLFLFFPPLLYTVDKNVIKLQLFTNKNEKYNTINLAVLMLLNAFFKKRPLVH